MLGDGIHHDAKGQDVTTHNEDGEQQLANSKELPPEGTEQNLACIAQVLNMRIARVELANNQSSICGEKAEADDQDESTARYRSTPFRGY